MTDPAPPPAADEGAAAAAAALRRATKSTPRARTRTSRPTPASYSDDRDPQPLSSAVGRLVREQGWQDQSAVAVLMAEWAAIVGADVAGHVTPTSFEDGVLTLSADSTAWATQVRLLLPQVHRTVDERIGAGIVTRLRIQGPQAPGWTAGPRRVKGRGPRDTYG